METIVEVGSSKTGKVRKGTAKKPVLLSSVSGSKYPRMESKISELDRVLGGGIVPGQVILMAGEPGIGKSTILMQLSDMMGNTLYVSGEESVHQIKLRADRLNIKKSIINIMEETDIDLIIDSVNTSETEKPKLIVIDSIQTMSTTDLSGMAGSAGQVRECAYRLVKLAKANNIPIVIVGHVTKQGSVAGPALLMHIVDTVLWFEGSKDLSYRMLRARKNRFGPTDEVGIFTMEEKGLVSVDDTATIFLSETEKKISGSCISVIMEGTRPVMIEVQSLLVPTKLAFAKRVANGIDAKKLEVILAVLQRRSGLKLDNYDCFVNVVGGMKIKDPAIDLATCLSISSSYFDKPLSKKMVVMGEVGLLGEIRSVTSQEKRIKEARRLGFKASITDSDSKYVNEVVGKMFK